MEERKCLKAGSRKSELALIQTNIVIDKIKEISSGCRIEVSSMTTIGDQVLDKPLSKVGKNVFTKELEEPLAEGQFDFVVHSMKDVSTSQPEGLTIGGVLRREDPLDAVLTTSKYKGVKLSDLPAGSVIGTSSLRRAAQLRSKHSHLVVKDIRGNLNTRLKKLDESGTYTAVVLALAGVRRMGWEDRVSQILLPSDMLYAVGQGALAVQCRSDDNAMLDILSQLSDSSTVLRVIAERTFMQTLGGGCTAPLAVDSELIEDTLRLTGGVWNLDGSITLMHTMTKHFPSEDDEPPRKLSCLESKTVTGITAKNVDPKKLEVARQLGEELAEYLINRGADEIISEAKRIVGAPTDLPEKLENNQSNGVSVKS